MTEGTIFKFGHLQSILDGIWPCFHWCICTETCTFWALYCNSDSATGFDASSFLWDISHRKLDASNPVALSEKLSTSKWFSHWFFIEPVKSLPYVNFWCFCLFGMISALCTVYTEYYFQLSSWYNHPLPSYVKILCDLVTLSFALWSWRLFSASTKSENPINIH